MARLFLRNGRIFCGRPGTGFAEACAIAGSRVLAVGSEADVAAIATGFEEVDLSGGVAVPAFCDSHIHLLMYAVSLATVALAGSKSQEEAAGRVAARAQLSRPGSWISGIGWSKEEFSDRRFPTRYALDKVSPDNPVVLYSRDYHSLWLNSAALSALGIDRSTPAVQGGSILKDEGGEPTGVLLENMAKVAYDRIPKPTSSTIAASMDSAFEKLYSLGILSAHNMDSDGDLSLLSSMKAAGRLGIRVVGYIGKGSLDGAISAGMRTGFGDSQLRFGGLKLIKDGTLGSQTALMLEPFEGSLNRGIDLIPDGELNELVRRANGAGVGVAVHAIGDAANRSVLDAFSRSGSAETKLINRVEHAQLLTEEDLPRLASLGLAASMQPVHMEGDIEPANLLWGERTRYAYAAKSLLRSGSPLLFGSDAPVADPDPMKGICTAVTRKDPDGKPERGWHPEERLTVEEAVRAYTWNPASLFGDGGTRGSIETGKIADIAILSEDIFTIAKERIRKARVTATIREGEFVFRA